MDLICATNTFWVSLRLFRSNFNNVSFSSYNNLALSFLFFNYEQSHLLLSIWECRIAESPAFLRQQNSQFTPEKNSAFKLTLILGNTEPSLTHQRPNVFSFFNSKLLLWAFLLNFVLFCYAFNVLIFILKKNK